MCENMFFVGGVFITADTFEIELACLELASPSLLTVTTVMSLSSLKMSAKASIQMIINAKL